MTIQVLHILWGEHACALYRRGVIDNHVKIAHSAYKFASKELEQAFLYGIRESRKKSDWMIVEDIRGLQALGIPLRTRLIDAVMRGDEQAVERVLKDGVSPDVRAANGLTALALAAGIGAVLVVEKLLDFGANVDDPGDGPTPANALHVAATSTAPGATKCLDKIAEKSKDLDSPSPDGKTPLIRAIEAGRHESALALLNQGAKPTITDNLGRTPRQVLEEKFDTSALASMLMDTLVKQEMTMEQAFAKAQALIPSMPLRPSPYNR